MPGNSRPLYLKQNVQTIRKYTAVWKKILQYIWRTEAVVERHRYHLTHVQKQALVKLQYAARDKSTTVRENVVDASLAFWVAMFDRELPDNEYESGLLNGLAAIGANGEKGWVLAINYTPMLTAVITMMQHYDQIHAVNCRKCSEQEPRSNGALEERLDRDSMGFNLLGIQPATSGSIKQRRSILLLSTSVIYLRR